MGCAGSRPNLLPNLSSNHNLSSPHKGFILFDSKTIEYLKVNELEIKQKLKERCELKLFITLHIFQTAQYLNLQIIKKIQLFHNYERVISTCINFQVQTVNNKKNKEKFGSTCSK